MNSNVLEYKGYHTKVEFIAETKSLYGKIEGINDLVTFEADSLDNVEKEFHLAVDDYLIFCEDIGQSPDKEYRGSFNVRIKPELHRALALKADRDGISMNAAIEKAVSNYVSPETNSKETIIVYSEQSTSLSEWFPIPSDWNNPKVIPIGPSIAITQNYAEVLPK